MTQARTEVCTTQNERQRGALSVCATGYFTGGAS